MQSVVEECDSPTPQAERNLLVVVERSVDQLRAELLALAQKVSEWIGQGEQRACVFHFSPLSPPWLHPTQVSGGAKTGQAATDAIGKRLDELESQLKVGVIVNAWCDDVNVHVHCTSVYCICTCTCTCTDSM